MRSTELSVAALASLPRWFLPSCFLPGCLLLSCLLLSVACAGDEAPLAPAADADITTPALEFMTPCDVADDRCDMESEHFCFAFNDKGPHCTHACVAPEDCEAPSTGCNNRGVCKAPDPAAS